MQESAWHRLGQFELQLLREATVKLPGRRVILRQVRSPGLAVLLHQGEYAIILLQGAWLATRHPALEPNQLGPLGLPVLLKPIGKDQPQRIVVGLVHDGRHERLLG